LCYAKDLEETTMDFKKFGGGGIFEMNRLKNECGFLEKSIQIHPTLPLTSDNKI
jgi:hypothetical protein